MHGEVAAVCVFVLTLLSASDVSKGTPCASFIFPNTTDYVETAEENTFLTVPFQLNITNCKRPMRDDFKITVSKKDQATAIYGDFCYIFYINERCAISVPNSGCLCVGHNFIRDERYLNFEFRKFVTLSDSTTWVWFTDNGLADSQQIQLNITPYVETTTTSTTRRAPRIINWTGGPKLNKDITTTPTAEKGNNSSSVAAGIISAFIVVIFVLIVVIIALKRKRKAAKLTRRPTVTYPAGFNPAPIKMRPVVSALAVSDPRYGMHVTREEMSGGLLSETVAFIPDDDFCSHSVYPSYRDSKQIA